ncbi:hypothetical protein [Methanococcus maripaludis]|uniref:DUF4304 domain-containing protein n=1 Tax=Methanococcus maripaludis TaxID=39152 RepID=A0A7J9PEE7_METMI|nr:hypothetical protein [Methanococcus maripaludis]MBA2861047.1 hypothetical protein [Methanococcus maripaludis]MBA2868922.1 hypothetical protein [Methanococcus maripaludis]
MARAFNKFAKKYIGDIMEEEGFVPYKTTYFIRLTENNRLVQFISFSSGASGGCRYLEVGYLPLFMKHESNTISSEIHGRMKDRPPCGWGSFCWKFPKGDMKTAEESMIEIKNVIIKYTIPYLNRYCTFESILEMLEEDKPDVVPEVYNALSRGKSHHKGYFAMGAGDYKKAEKYFKESYSRFKPENRIKEISRWIMEELEEILDAIHDNDKIEQVMEKNRQHTIELMKLRKYIAIN